jgi:hypothetical protein
VKRLTLSFTTFLKICARTPRGKIGEIRRFTGSGGYDFYKVMKRLATEIAEEEICLQTAKEAISQIKRDSEREHTFTAISNFHEWFAKEPRQWVAPPGALYTSPSGLIAVRLAPELAFLKSDGTVEVLYLWNLANPELTNELAGEGLWLLADELGHPKNEFGILNLRKQIILPEGLAGTASGLRLKHDLMTIEQIWKDVNNPSISTDETISHIVALKLPAPHTE